MLIGKEMAGEMNAQIGHEFGASLQYVNVAGYFDDAGLPVLAQFFLKQADEERMHAMKFVRYIMDAGGRVAIPAIPAAGTSSRARRKRSPWRSTGSTR